MNVVSPEYVCGIDEVGRGPLAGPVTVGLVMYKKKDQYLFDNIPLRDSKKLSPKKRAEIVVFLKQLEKDGLVYISTVSVAPASIDTYGIAPCIKKAIEKNLQKISMPHTSVEVLLDGGLSAPDSFMHQSTIVGGDAKERSIGLASILAKVTRDTYMVGQSKEYPEYGFDSHKGYGTKAHYAALNVHGTTPLHRITYLKNHF